MILPRAADASEQALLLCSLWNHQLIIPVIPYSQRLPVVENVITQ